MPFRPTASATGFVYDEIESTTKRATPGVFLYIYDHLTEVYSMYETHSESSSPLVRPAADYLCVFSISLL